ncbi:hypothetical protein PFISCL1PPCAC_27257, partial [Pristionchus fissidentatus]
RGREREREREREKRGRVRSFHDLLSPIALVIHPLMRPISIISALGFLSLITADAIRPAAIIPWSEYQKRLREQVEEEQRALADEDIASLSSPPFKQSPIPATEGALKPFPDSMMKSLQRPIDEFDLPSYSTGSVNNKVMQSLKKPRPSGQSVIRPQLRTRRPDDPRVFMKKKIPKEVDPPHYNPPLSKPPFAMVDASRPNHLPRGAINAIERQGTSNPLAPLSPSAARRQSVDPLQFGSHPQVNSVLTKPLENEVEDRSPFITNPLSPSYSRLGPAPGLILGNGNGQPNIVNSIFSQSQAHGVVSEIPMGGIPNGIPSLPQPPVIPQLP